MNFHNKMYNRAAWSRTRVPPHSFFYSASIKCLQHSVVPVLKTGISPNCWNSKTDSVLVFSIRRLQIAVDWANEYKLGWEQRCLRLLQCFPLQPDGQSQTLGRTHLPPFMHVGSHTPAGTNKGRMWGLENEGRLWCRLTCFLAEG